MKDKAIPDGVTEKSTELPSPMNNRLWELYAAYCQSAGLRATLKGYVIWFDEHYS